MDTPITLSSTSTVPNKSDFLQLNYSPGNNEESVISLSSTSLERGPGNWKSSSNVLHRTDSNASLSNMQKVSNWIKSIDEPKREPLIVDLDDGINDNCSPGSDKSDTQRKGFNSDSKSIILVHCDFNKSVATSVATKAYYPPLTPFNRSAPLINFLTKDKKETVKSLGSSVTENTDIANEKISPNQSLNNTNEIIVQKHLLFERSDSNKHNYCNQFNKISTEKDVSKMNDGVSDGSSEIYEVPLSPESRKKELCSYLQLMNPADKKERFILQNRRSTRVRNLTAMQEKRKRMDNITKEGNSSEQSLKETEKCPTLKSFKELNIRVEKTKFNHELFKDKLGSEADVEKYNFCFPFPSKELTENIQDFDNTMSKLISRYKRICRIKKLKLNCKIGPNKSVSKIKDNVKNVLKVKHKIINHKEKNIQKKGSIIKVKPEVMEKTKESRMKDLLKKRYKKHKTEARIRNSLRSTGMLKNVSLKKLIGKKEKELVNRKNIRKKPTQGRRETAKKSTQSGKKSSSSETNCRGKSTTSHCEIVTVPKSSEDNYVDIENLMDDMIDFNNLSEEHKKCLIENRILSTKPTLQQSDTNIAEEERTQSFYSLQEMSPLYGFKKSDVNEVRKICQVYKNSVLNSGKEELIEDYLFGTSEVKLENVEINDGTEYKTEAKSAIEKLASVTDCNFEHEFMDINDDKSDAKSDEEEDDNSVSSRPRLTNGITLQEHDYAGLPSDDDIEVTTEVDVVTVPSKQLSGKKCTGTRIGISTRYLQKKDKFELLPYNKSVEMKSLHRSLQYTKRKTSNSLADQSFTREWDSDGSVKQKSKKQSHFISIGKQNGAVLKAFYIDFNLIVCQEKIVSFWMQTPLGNILGSQNMWIPRGQTQRLVLNGKCMQKESMEMVIAMETHVAYIELWTKEHKSDIREGPVADVFATVYFSKQRQSGLDKKVLQLENIKGFADDVQYSVMKNVPKIIVSWHSAHEDGSVKKTFIHAYELAADYQTVANIYNIEPVDHYVSSLHNIEECDSLIMGCGENKITLWNLEYGYTVATIELSEIKSPLSTLWVKCDRGFLFALQQCVDRELRLIAINGINHSWKKLASYIPPEGFDRLRGVCIENGLLLSFYDQGILCWKAETGEPVEETNIESDIIPSGKYVILIEDEQILVRHAMTHLMSLSVDET